MKVNGTRLQRIRRYLMIQLHEAEQSLAETGDSQYAERIADLEESLIRFNKQEEFFKSLDL